MSADEYCIDDSASSVHTFESDEEEAADTSYCDERESKKSKINIYETNYVCLAYPDGVEAEVANAVSEAQELTALDEAEAMLVQKHFKWQLGDLTEKWFNDSDKVKSSVGIIPADQESMSTPPIVLITSNSASSSSNSSPTPSTATPTSSSAIVSYGFSSASRAPAPVNCPVCFELMEPETRLGIGEGKRTFDAPSKTGLPSFAMPVCGHRFCVDCWEGYLKSAVGEGPSCLNLRCMSPKCSVAVRWNLFRDFCSKEVRDRFEEFKQRNFVENNPNCKWCPIPDCPNAILVKEPIQTIEMQFVKTRQSGGNALLMSDKAAELSTCSKEVLCKCGWRWCFACNEEAHRGISCYTVKKWVEKNVDEAENVTWILANTKPCPKCQNPIEKNQGCMHMSCRCGHQFCWLCLADDLNYSHTRDGRPCNKFLEEPDIEIETSQRNLARYAHYFERYRSHHHSQNLASSQTMKEVRGMMETFHQQTGKWMDVLFLEEAIQQVIDCRRMLKWTYAHGYFATVSDHDKDFFEFQQGQLEQKVDQLQAEFEKFDKPNKDEDGANVPKETGLTPTELEEKFYNMKLNLTNLTKVVDSFFNKLSEFFENHSEKQRPPPSAKAEDMTSSSVGLAGDHMRMSPAQWAMHGEGRFVAASVLPHPVVGQPLTGGPMPR